MLTQADSGVGHLIKIQTWANNSHSAPAQITAISPIAKVSARKAPPKSLPTVAIYMLVEITTGEIACTSIKSNSLLI